MNYAPIVLFTYNRPKHTEKTLSSLEANAAFKYSKVYIYSDAAKSDMDIHAVNQVRDLLSNFKKKKSCVELNIITAEVNRGLANSIIDGVTEVLKKHDRIIVLEDDCLVSPYFLNFMNNSLDFYKNSNYVGSISGYSPPINIPKEYKNDIFLISRTNSIGWATWEDRWNKIDWSEKPFNIISKDYKMIKKFNLCGSDRYFRLGRQMKYNVQSWSVRFGVNQLLQGYATIFPKFSYVMDIGNDGTGVHYTNTQKFDVQLSKAIKRPVLIKDITTNKNVEKAFYRFYSGNLVRRLTRSLRVIPYMVEARMK